MPIVSTEAAAVKDKRQERPSPMTLSGFMVMITAMAVEAVVLVILLKPSPIAVATQVRPGEESPRRTTAELLAPTVLMPEVVVSVPVTEGGADLMTAVVSVAIKLGKAEGRSDEELDLRYLERVYVPRLEALMPRFRHELIMVLNRRTYSQLRETDVQNKILEDMQRSMNRILADFSVEPRIGELYWNSFHFD